MGGGRTRTKTALFESVTMSLSVYAIWCFVFSLRQFYSMTVITSSSFSITVPAHSHATVAAMCSALFFCMKVVTCDGMRNGWRDEWMHSNSIFSRPMAKNRGTKIDNNWTESDFLPSYNGEIVNFSTRQIKKCKEVEKEKKKKKKKRKREEEKSAMRKIPVKKESKGK